MAEPGAKEAVADRRDLPAVIKVEQETEVWRDVQDFKVQRQQTGGRCDEGGSGGKRSSGWEIVDCSHASECGSPARTLPGSEFGLSEQTGDQADLAPDFHEAHARALAQIEALEAAEREGTREGNSPRGATPLPVSTDDGQLKAPQPAQVLSVSSDSSCGTPLASGHFGDLGIDEVLEVAVLSDEAAAAVEVWSGGVGTRELCACGEKVEVTSARSEPDSHEAMVDLQEMSQEGSLDGSYWPECGAGQETGEVGVLQSVKSFEDRKSIEGAFSEMSFESPKCAQCSIQANLPPDFSLGVETLRPDVQMGCQEESEGAAQGGRKSVKETADLSGEMLWLCPNVQQLVQRWTTLAMGLLPTGVVPQWLSVADTVSSSFNWKGVAYGAGLAMLSALVVGLIFQNRRLSNEVRKKQEEVTRLAKALMNFQELWSTHRTGKMPILRHTNFTNILPDQDPF